MSIVLALLLAAQMEHHHGGEEHLGTVNFTTSCAPAAQATFTRAVALLHSFWYEQSEKAFRQVASIDPQCGMAWWGVGMSDYHQVWPTPYTPAEFARGKEAAEKAKSIGAKTPREQGYIDAVANLYRVSSGAPEPALSAAEGPTAATDPRAYESSMERLVAQYPDDDEASIFYSLILINHGMSMPKDKTYAYQKKAGEILNRLLVKHPDHPGIAHYLIHSFDYPALAPLALNAANTYAKIAPSSPHALHMPSHIYVRLGMWQETIESNIASEKAASAYAMEAHPGAMSFDALHADDYLAYAWLQRGEDDKVRELVQKLSEVKAIDIENFAAYYALAAVPARYTLERRSWSEAAALKVTSWDQYPYAEALTHFARAMGAARSGDVASARTDVERLDQLRKKLTGYWADQIEGQRRAAEGWIARAEGRNDDAVTLLQSAADLEDSMDKSPVTPGPPIPAREMLGDLLLELNQPAKALEAYERSLKDSPNRLNGLSGAGRAAHLIGDRARARAYSTQLAKLF